MNTLILQAHWKIEIKIGADWVKGSSNNNAFELKKHQIKWIEFQHWEDLPMKLFLLHLGEGGRERGEMACSRIRV